VEGTYQIEYQSPFDSGKAILQLTEKDDVLLGKLSIHEKDFELTHGEQDQNRFNFTGKFSILGIDIAYMIRGIVNDNILNAKVHTALGVIVATGFKIK